MYMKEIVCLANSRKPPSGRCIAGRELLDNALGEWVRPVSSRPTREISEEERRYEDGRDLRVLHIVRIPLGRPEPERHQRENHLIDDNYWEHVGRYPWEALADAQEDVETLWLDGSSSWHGSNDRIAEDQLDDLSSSLLLVQPEELTIQVAPEGGTFSPERRRVRARFGLGRSHYRIVVTDPVVERKFLEGGNGTFPIEQAILCVSLTEPFHGFAYKLAAAVITPDRMET